VAVASSAYGVRPSTASASNRAWSKADGLTELPAAVEVAAFRIAVEAVNNAVRHARAHRYQVRLAIDRPGQLLVEVCDDGAGREPWPPGVGLSAMRERATELGGTLTAGPGPSGGTVRAYLPLPAAVTLSAAGNAPITETQSTEETP
jgi:two-component system NarL family sensor kinase